MGRTEKQELKGANDKSVLTNVADLKRKTRVTKPDYIFSGDDEVLP